MICDKLIVKEIRKFIVQIIFKNPYSSQQQILNTFFCTYFNVALTHKMGLQFEKL